MTPVELRREGSTTALATAGVSERALCFGLALAKPSGGASRGQRGDVHPRVLRTSLRSTLAAVTRRRIAPLAPLVAACIITVAAAPAHAAVRTFHADDPMDAQDQSPTLNPRPLNPDITAVDATYDDVGGTVAVAVTFAAEDDRLPDTAVALGCAKDRMLRIDISRCKGYESPSSASRTSRQPRPRRSASGSATTGHSAMLTLPYCRGSSTPERLPATSPLSPHARVPMHRRALAGWRSSPHMSCLSAGERA